jgi:sec-independent protein translocase protein TatC
MTFWEHIYEIRNRLLIVFIAFLCFSIASYIFFPYFIEEVLRIIGEQLFATSIGEGFLTRVKTAVSIGGFFTIPVFLFELMLFLFPALTKKEKGFLLGLLIAAFVLFVGGIAMAYKLILPAGIQFLKSKDFFPGNVGRLISYNDFITFFMQFLVGVGVCFQFPIALIFLMKVGVLKVDLLIKYLKYFIAGAFLAAAIITPSVDMVSQTLLAAPMILLYLICILIGKVFRIGV